MSTLGTVPAPAQRDNLFGICHAIGEAFGFNPIYLRLVLVLGVLFDFELALSLYFGAGVAVLVANLLTRRGRAASTGIPLAAR